MNGKESLLSMRREVKELRSYEATFLNFFAKMERTGPSFPPENAGNSFGMRIKKRPFALALADLFCSDE